MEMDMEGEQIKFFFYINTFKITVGIKYCNSFRCAT